MKKQLLLSAAGIAAVLSLFFFGNTSPKKSENPVVKETTSRSFDIISYLEDQKKSLSQENRKRLDSLQLLSENGEPAEKSLKMSNLADFWHDSAHNLLLYSHFITEAAKLDNSVKNLNFAAQYSLSLLRSENDSSKAAWLSSNAVELFERAISQDPTNDDFKIGLGSVYIFGQGSNGNPESTMKGIMQILEVARRDSANMKAQLMLGIGGFISGQYDKAEKRLKKVVEKDPGNLEAVAFLADTYAAQGKNEEAVKWYEISKRLANDPQYSKEADERIRVLRNNR